MAQLVFRKAQLKPRFINVLSVSLLLGGVVMVTEISPAAPAESAAHIGQPSVAGEQPNSSIATPGYSLVARSQPRAKKDTVPTKPGIVAKSTEKENNSKDAATKSVVAKTGAPTAVVARTLLTKPAVAEPIQAGDAAKESTPVAKPVVPRLAEAKIEAKPADTKLAVRPSAAKTAEAKAAEEKARQEKILLAQLEADLRRTEKRLDTTNQKLSAGQKELLSLTSTLRTVMDESGEDAAGLHPFVRVASRYAGTPYVWGGESRYGFDCSGFIIRVMRDLGYRALPHSAAEQFKYGKPIAESLLKPGDIVFFANTYKPGISHVGIYIGKRRFIHAASTRQGTIVSSLDASPYRQKYAGARRLLAVRKSA